jgi:hypothetical protein
MASYRATSTISTASPSCALWRAELRGPSPVPPSGLLGRWLLSQGKPLRLRPPRVALLPQFCNGGPKILEPLLSYGCSLPRLRKGRGISLR